MTDQPTEQEIARAREIVAALEHGDEKHRQWLRNEASPLIATALAEARVTAYAAGAEAMREEATQAALKYRDEADDGKHPDMGDPEHSLGQGMAANTIAKRIRALPLPESGVSNVPHAPVVSTRVARDSEMVERVARVIAAQDWDMPAEHYDRCAARVDAGAEHDGDCTHQCHTCHVCMIGEIRETARLAIDAALSEARGASVGPAPSSTVTQESELTALKVDIARTLEIASREATRADALEKQIEKMRRANDLVGKWLSPALNDDTVSLEMKSDIYVWFLAQSGAALSETAANTKDGGS